MENLVLNAAIYTVYSLANSGVLRRATARRHLFGAARYRRPLALDGIQWHPTKVSRFI